MKEFKSLIFGTVQEADYTEKETIKNLVNKCPVDVFAAVNRKLNSLGYCLAISAESEIEFPGFNQVGSHEKH